MKKSLILTAFTAMAISASAALKWTTEQFIYKNTAYAPAEYRVLGDSTGDSADGNLFTYDETIAKTDQSYVVDFSDSPINLEAIRIYAGKDTGRDDYGITGIDVMYSGSSTWTAIAGTELAYNQLNYTSDPFASHLPNMATCRYDHLEDSSGANIADNIIGVRINFGTCENNYASICELEIVGTELAVSEDPKASVAAVDIGENAASLELSLTKAGGTVSAADVYFAYAVSGSALPAPALLLSGVSAGVYTNSLSSLATATSYDYSFVITNSAAGVTNITGTFTTTAHIVSAWETVKYYPYNSSAELVYAPATNRLNAADTNEPLVTDGDLSTKSETNNRFATDSSYEFDFGSETLVDLEEIRIYTAGDTGRDDISVASIEVKYRGSSDWTAIAGSALEFTELNYCSENYWNFTAEYWMKNKTCRYDRFYSPSGEKLASGVKAVRINFGTMDNGYASIYEIEICGSNARTKTGMVIMFR